MAAVLLSSEDQLWVTTLANCSSSPISSRTRSYGQPYGEAV
jgi:hypothetical protein